MLPEVTALLTYIALPVMRPEVGVYEPLDVPESTLSVS